MLDFLKVHYLILAFSVGIFFVYVTTPAPRLVNKFPGPHNVEDLIYRDQSDSCYKYEAEVVECDENSKPQPIIEDFTKTT